MDKILELGDVFSRLVGDSDSKFSPVLLIPVLFVIISSVAVFIYGFKKTDDRPKYRKSTVTSEESSSGGGGGSGNIKRKKRETAAVLIKSTKKEIIATTAAAKKQERSPTSAAVEKNIIKNVATSAKNVQSKSKTLSKSQQAPKIKNKKADKVINDIVEGGGDSGGWQTVLNKKQQKKQVSNTAVDPLIQVAAVADSKNKVLKSKTVKKKADNIIPVSKNIEEKDAVKAPLNESEAYSAPLFASEVLPAAGADTLDNIAVAQLDVASALEPSLSAPETNLMFDELGDAAWMESKPQKRNKKRVLRE